MTRQSGSSLRGEARSRRGNHRLKNAMFLAAFASLRDPDSSAFYDRKRADGKRHNAAVICLARRRCDVILAMLRSSTPYQAKVPHDQPVAATRIALDCTALAKVETGNRHLSALELASLARATGLPIDWFVAESAPIVASRRASLKGDTLR